MDFILNEFKQIGLIRCLILNGLHHDRHHYLYSTSYIESRIMLQTMQLDVLSQPQHCSFLLTEPNYLFPAVIVVFDRPPGKTT